MPRLTRAVPTAAAAAAAAAEGADPVVDGAPGPEAALDPLVDPVVDTAEPSWM
jgi:hypothetical protein